MGERTGGSAAVGAELGMVLYTGCPARIDELDGPSENSHRCPLGFYPRGLCQSSPMQSKKSTTKIDEEGFLGRSNVAYGLGNTTTKTTLVCNLRDGSNWSETGH